MNEEYAQLSLGGNNNQTAVKQLQQLLNEKNGAGLEVDGIFGSKTERAVRNYQSANGLEADGIVGRKTWQSLLGTGASVNPDIPAISTPVEAAKEKLDAFSANAPGEFAFSEQALLDMTEKAYRDREAFAYDPNADALYRQYKDHYTTQGRQAMEDTIGVAQAMTGGYSNTYAQTAGQQAYQGYLQELGDVLPQLYELAYEKYTDETDLLRQQYEFLAKQRETAHDAHAAEQKRYDSEKQALYEQYQDALQHQEKQYTKLVALLQLGYFPTEAELAAAGMTRAMAKAIWQGG